jgi:hypothetical protein
VTVDELQALVDQGRAAADAHEAALAAAYERVLAGVARRAARSFREGATLLAVAEDWAPPPRPEDLVDAEAAARSARRRAGPIQESALAAVVSPTTGVLGISFEVASPLLERIVQGLAVRAETVAEGIGPIVSDVIRRAHAEGLSVAETAKLILARINTLKPYQALLLARSDLVAIGNGGSLAAAEAARSAGVAVKTKTWLTAGDERVRPTHVAASGQTVPLDQFFLVGVGSLQYPGDPSGPPEEVWACRCSVTFGEGAVRSAPSPTSAEGFADDLIGNARRAEAEVTRDLRGLPGTLEGLEFRLKTAESLARKIRMDARFENITEAEAAGKINDALRYTKVFSPEEYAANVRGVVTELQERGYSVVKWKDTWDGEMYKGINAVFRSPSGSRFELQFHTPKSFDLKNRINHRLYEAWRLSQDARERYRLSSRMRRNSRRVDRPPDSAGYDPLL